MRRAWILAILVAVLGAGLPARADASARTSYYRALGWEKSARAALARRNATSGAAAEARRVITAYKKVVARYPRSGYSDNALWQAAQLCADLWSRFGNDNDRDEAVRLYKALVRSYPYSSLVRKAKVETRQLETAARRAREERAEPVPETGSITAKDVDDAAKPAVRAVRTVPSAGQTATVESIRRTELPSGERVTIELDREVVYHQDRIANPERLFVDFDSAKLSQAVHDSKRNESAIVKQVRVGTPEEDTTRVVLDIDRSARHSMFVLYAPYRLVIDVERADARRADPVLTAGAAPASESAVQPAVERTDGKGSSPSDAESRRSLAQPASTPSAEARSAESTANVRGGNGNGELPTRGTAAEASEPAPAPVLPAPPAANLHGEFSLSRQLGLGISRIVIDPGHGGRDPGAQSHGLTESELVLDVALRLEALLKKQPGVDVVMTRRTDVFVPLEERTAIANREDADLFLSIHANASRNRSARGVETYFLNFASNPEAQEVAARENAASGRTMHSLPEIVKAITLNNKLDESRDFATMVQRSMVKGLRPANHHVRDLGVKQAPFVVLIGAGMPSVLAEISFVTHPQEGKLLKKKAYRQRIAEALFEGIATYQHALKNVKTVANQ